MASRNGLPTALLELAERQRGHVTRHQAVAAGLTVGQVRVRLERGEWHVQYPRVYRLAGVQTSWESDVAACLLAAGPAAAVSHGAAARLLGLNRARRVARIEITVRYGARTKPGRSAELPLTMEEPQRVAGQIRTALLQAGCAHLVSA